MISILKLKSGNISSVANMLKHLGHEVEIIHSKSQLRKVKKIILPGIGSFEETMNYLKENDLIDSLQNLILKDEIPTLGICMGMQILLNSSEEGNFCSGLSIFSEKLKKFDKNHSKVPHVGWNHLNIINSKEMFLGEKNYFYFSHSFYLEDIDNENTISISKNGKKFISAIQKKNVIGVQFHPEKSHRYGFHFLDYFARNFYV